MPVIWHHFRIVSLVRFSLSIGGILGQTNFSVFTQGEDEDGGISGNLIKTEVEEPISAITRYVSQKV